MAGPGRLPCPDEHSTTAAAPKGLRLHDQHQPPSVTLSRNEVRFAQSPWQHIMTARQSSAMARAKYTIYLSKARKCNCLRCTCLQRPARHLGGVQGLL